MNKRPPKQFLVTGPPGIGKTTLVKKVCESLRKQNIPCHGFYTEELRVGGKRQGFDVVSLDGQRAVLARAFEAGARHDGPVVGQYAVDIPSFEQVALPIMSKKDEGVGVIDEIGKMELYSRKFGDKVLQMFHDNRLLLVTVPVRPLPFVNRLKSVNPSAVVITDEGVGVIDEIGKMELYSRRRVEPIKKSSCE